MQLDTAVDLWYTEYTNKKGGIITVRVTVLCENVQGNEKVKSEHGLSLYVEANGKRILFDMGQSGLFAENAASLGIDLSAENAAVLSHGHCVLS